MAVNDAGDNVLHEARSAECVEVRDCLVFLSIFLTLVSSQVLFKGLSSQQRRQLLAGRGQDGALPLHRAAARGREVAEMYVDTYPEGLHERDQLGETPLFVAVRAQQLDVLALLLESGTDVGARNDEDLTAVHVAVAEKKDFALELLMYGALVSEETVAQLRTRQQDDPGADESVVPDDGADSDDEVRII